MLYTLQVKLDLPQMIPQYCTYTIPINLVILIVIQIGLTGNISKSKYGSFNQKKHNPALMEGQFFSGQGQQPDTQ